MIEHNLARIRLKTHSYALHKDFFSFCSSLIKNTESITDHSVKINYLSTSVTIYKQILMLF